MPNSSTSHQGFTLLELLVALTVSSIAVLVVQSLFFSSQLFSHKFSSWAQTELDLEMTISGIQADLSSKYLGSRLSIEESPKILALSFARPALHHLTSEQPKVLYVRWTIDEESISRKASFELDELDDAFSIVLFKTPEPEKLKWTITEDNGEVLTLDLGISTPFKRVILRR